MAERYVPAASMFITIGLEGESQLVVFCIVSITRNYTLNITDAASICNPVAKSPGTQDTSVDLSLQRVWEPDVTHYSEKFLHDAFNNKNVIEYTISPATPVTGDLIETGNGYISSMTKTDNATDLGTMDITITNSELPVITIE
jgi:hypothetical protein